MNNQPTDNNQQDTIETTTLLPIPTSEPIVLSTPRLTQASPRRILGLFDAEKDLLRETGNPNFQEARIRHCQDLYRDHIIIDGLCEFIFSEHPKKKITIKCLKNLDPVFPSIDEESTLEDLKGRNLTWKNAIEMTNEERFNIEDTLGIETLTDNIGLSDDETFNSEDTNGLAETLRDNISLSNMMVTLNNWIISPLSQQITQLNPFAKIAPTFENVYNEAKREFSWYYKQKLYAKALELASNDLEYTLATEGLVNALHTEYELDSAELNKIPSQYFPDNAEAQRNERTRVYIERTNKTLKRIESAMNQLPANYHQIMPSVKLMNRQFQEVFEQLEQGKQGDARLLFKSIFCTKTNPFLKHAFPWLPAMWYQLSGIFNMLTLEGYMILPHTKKDGEATDKQLGSRVLLIYLKDDSIYCGCVTPEGTVDRFPIPDSDLCNEAATIRAYLKEEAHHFGDEQKEAIFRIVAAKGYYQCEGASPASALFCFSKAHDLVQQYYPALAKQMHKEIIVPFEALMQEATRAKQTTPKDTQLRLARIHWAEVKHWRLNIIGFPPAPKEMSDEEWGALFPEDDDTEEWLSIYRPA